MRSPVHFQGLRDCSPDFLPDFQRACHVQQGTAEDHELVSAKPAHGVRVGDSCAHPFGHFQEHPVAGVVAEAVIELLEAIKVTAPQRNPGRDLSHATGSEAFDESLPVEEVRQRIVGRAVHEARLSGAGGGHVLKNHEGEDLLGVFRDRGCRRDDCELTAIAAAQPDLSPLRAGAVRIEQSPACDHQAVEVVSGQLQSGGGDQAGECVVDFKNFAKALRRVRQPRGGDRRTVEHELHHGRSPSLLGAVKGHAAHPDDRVVAIADRELAGEIADPASVHARGCLEAMPLARAHDQVILLTEASRGLRAVQILVAAAHHVRWRQPEFGGEYLVDVHVPETVRGGVVVLDVHLGGGAVRGAGEDLSRSPRSCVLLAGVAGVHRQHEHTGGQHGDVDLGREDGAEQPDGRRDEGAPAVHDPRADPDACGDDAHARRRRPEPKGLPAQHDHEQEQRTGAGNGLGVHQVDAQ